MKGGKIQCNLMIYENYFMIKLNILYFNNNINVSRIGFKEGFLVAQVIEEKKNARLF